MHDKGRGTLGGWAGLAGVVVLLALCLILLSGQAAGAEDRPIPQEPTADRTALDLGAPAARQETGFRRPSAPLAAGDWDGYWVRWPRVISDTDKYRMWYAGFNLNNPGLGYMLGLAESADGTSWTKSPSNPVPGPGVDGAAT